MPSTGEKMNNFDGLSDKRVKKSKKLPKDIIGVRVPHNYVILPNTDHRYQYPKRFASFLNNADPVGLRNFLLEHCTDNCTIIYRYNGETNPVGPLLSKLKSPNELANVWDTALVIYPDYVFKVVDTVVQRDADSNCSFIKSSYISSFTKLLKPNILSSNGENGNNGPPALLEDDHAPCHTESSASKPTTGSSHPITITSTVAVAAERAVNDEKEEEDEPLDELIDYWFLNETGGEVKTTAISEENKAISGTTTAAVKHSSSNTSQTSSSMTSAATREDITIKSDTSNVEQNNSNSSNSNSGEVTKKRRRRINEVEAVTTFINSEIDAETKWLNGKLLPSPVSIEYHGKFVMHLNDEGKINKIVYFYKLAEHLEEGFKLY